MLAISFTFSPLPPRMMVGRDLAQAWEKQNRDRVDEI